MPGSVSHPKLTQAPHDARREKRKACEDAIREARAQTERNAAIIADEFGRSMTWSLGQVMQQAKSTRMASGWSAFTTDKLNEENQSVPTNFVVPMLYVDVYGSERVENNLPKLKLKEFTSIHMATVSAAWQKLSKLEKEKYQAEAKNRQEAKTKKSLTPLPYALSRAQSAQKHYDKESVKWDQTLKSQMMEGMYIAVRGRKEESMRPETFSSAKAREFFIWRFHITPEQFALELDGYCIIDQERKCESSKTMRRRTLHNLREAIQTELSNLLDRDVKMNYENYEVRIVLRYGVTLEGVPKGCQELEINMKNPGMLRLDQQEEWLQAFEQHTCEWVRLSDDQLAARRARVRELEATGILVCKQRKTRSDKIDKSASKGGATALHDMQAATASAGSGPSHMMQRPATASMSTSCGGQMYTDLQTGAQDFSSTSPHVSFDDI
ncbi:hypothetical protein FISHEDRAFT_62874 [Fistulina hepatica ATCC 64428]|uniref:Uncharacterized protein n=1 Tax=Fistulina hepatica ATCC 64428 TaxID=1128425 RepID=A0A0D6ZZG3_9AGAR|nr:hypothetical protein FISHEDRAFT_62874 [Fistulina hepatica ATCC 64428]